MEAAYDPRCDETAAEAAEEGYHPNPSGLYEFNFDVIFEEEFPLQHEGKVVKVFPPPWGSLTHLPKAEYRVLWMLRSPDARMRSFSRFHKGRNMTMLNSAHYLNLFKSREMAAEASRFFVEARPDMDVLNVEYDDVVEHPLGIFETLKGQGWPIDPKKAAKIPDRGLRRF